MSPSLAEENANDQGRQRAHIQEAEKIQEALIRNMSPGQRLEIARDLYKTAWNIKKGALRNQYPDWSDEQINQKLRLIFITGYAGA